MLDQEITEFLIKCANNVAKSEERYLIAKQELEIEKAKLTCFGDWEKLLGKNKPTQKEKDSAVAMMTEDKKREVDDLYCKLNYCKKIFEINMLQNSVWTK